MFAKTIEESFDFTTSILPKELCHGLDAPTPCATRTSEVSIVNDDLENQFKLQPRTKSRRLSLVSIASVLNGEDSMDFDDTYDSAYDTG